MKKEIIEQGIAIIILVLVILFLVISVFKFNQMYNNYEIQGESFTIECDEIKMNVNNNNYVCTNEDYTYNFATINVLDLTKEYNIEIYYEQTSYFHWLAWWSNPKERQFRKIVVRSD